MALYASPRGDYELQRYPARPRETLQAWCAADTLLLEASLAEGVAVVDTGVVNDDHGALATALPAAWSWTDSFLAATALEANLERNGVAPVPLIWSTDTPPAARCVLLRIPKQLPYLEYQLATLAHHLPPDCLLLAAGMDKHLSPHTADIIERYFGPTTRHRGRNKARLFSAHGPRPLLPAAPGPARYHCAAAGGELEALPNVFSRDSLDIGSRFLLEQLPQLEPAQRAADLACGNGVIGLAALHQGLCQQLLFCDESAMAIASARNNAQRLAPADAGVVFHHGDGLQGVEGALELILCNPPFHLGHTVDDYAGRRLLTQCARQLAPGGRLYLVANRHLPYRPTLQRHFQAVRSLASNRKFTVWEALNS